VGRRYRSPGTTLAVRPACSVPPIVSRRPPGTSTSVEYLRVCCEPDGRRKVARRHDVALESSFGHRASPRSGSPMCTRCPSVPEWSGRRDSNPRHPPWQGSKGGVLTCGNGQIHSVGWGLSFPCNPGISRCFPFADGTPTGPLKPSPRRRTDRPREHVQDIQADGSLNRVRH
jgi:hypothetical protein